MPHLYDLCKPLNLPESWFPVLWDGQELQVFPWVIWRPQSQWVENHTPAAPSIRLLLISVKAIPGKINPSGFMRDQNDPSLRDVQLPRHVSRRELEAEMRQMQHQVDRLDRSGITTDGPSACSEGVVQGHYRLPSLSPAAGSQTAFPPFHLPLVNYVLLPQSQKRTAESTRFARMVLGHVMLQHFLKGSI